MQSCGRQHTGWNAPKQTLWASCGVRLDVVSDWNQRRRARRVPQTVRRCLAPLRLLDSLLIENGAATAQMSCGSTWSRKRLVFLGRKASHDSRGEEGILCRFQILWMPPSFAEAAVRDQRLFPRRLVAGRLHWRQLLSSPCHASPRRAV